MMIIELWAGKGFISFNNPRKKSMKRIVVYEFSTILADIIPERDRAGRSEYLHDV